MKIILKILVVVVLCLVFIVLYSTYSKNGNFNVNIKETISDYHRPEKLVGYFVPGLQIINTEKDSPLNRVGLTTLAGSEEYGESSLKSGDVITGIVIDYEKANFWDILTRQQKSEYFIPVDTEKELYDTLKKLDTNKIKLGIVRKTFKGISEEESGWYRYRPDIAVFSVDNLEGDYLKVKLEPNVNK